MQFDPRQVSTDFLKRWLAQHHLSNGVEAKPRSWWISKASAQQMILRIMLGAGRVNDKVNRSDLRELFVRHGAIARSTMPLLEVLMAFETTVLDSMTPEQFKSFTHNFQRGDINDDLVTSTITANHTTTTVPIPEIDTSVAKKRYLTSAKTRLAKKTKVPSLSTLPPPPPPPLSNNSSFFTLIDKHKTLSMLGLLVIASVLKMGVTFVSSDAKDTMIAKDTATGWSPEDLVMRGQGAISAAAQANQAEVLKTSILNTSVDEFARHHKIKFLSPGTVSRYAFNLALKGDARGVVGQTGLQLLSEWIPIRASDSISHRFASKLLRDQLKHSYLTAVKNF
jgi:hypothetical protein